MRFTHLNRRLHLYLGLFLLPWFLGYGISSLMFSHPRIGQGLYGDTAWKLRFERPYELPVSPDAPLKEVGAVLAREAGLAGTAGAYRPAPDRISVYVHTFWTATQLSYDIPKKVLRAEDRAFRWDHFLTGLHARGGFQHDSVLNDAWAVVVDFVCVGFLIWIGSGLYMWWHVSRHRNWGWLALAAGVGAFAVVLGETVMAEWMPAAGPVRAPTYPQCCSLNAEVGERLLACPPRLRSGFVAGVVSRKRT